MPWMGCPLLAGDVNGDCCVDAQDWWEIWDAIGYLGEACEDLNMDSSVNILDLIYCSNRFCDECT